MYTKFILNKDEVISIIALLAELKTQVKGIKDSKIKNEIFNFMNENFNTDDIIFFNNISKIMDNAKYLEFEI